MSSEHKNEGNRPKILRVCRGELLLMVDHGYQEAECKDLRSLQRIQDEAK